MPSAVTIRRSVADALNNVETVLVPEQRHVSPTGADGARLETP